MPCEEDEDLLAIQAAITEWQAGDVGIELTIAIDQICRGVVAEQLRQSSHPVDPREVK